MDIMGTLTLHTQHLNQVCQNQLCLLDLQLLLGLHHLVHNNSARPVSRMGLVHQDLSHTGFKALHLQVTQDLPILPTVISPKQPSQILHLLPLQHNLLTSSTACR